jgi:hypothetical protein
MLYDDSEQLEVRYVISLAYHDISIYAGGEDMAEGELFIRRNAIALTRKESLGDVGRETIISKPFYLFCENCSDKEDFYYALLQSDEADADQTNLPAEPLHFDVKNIITLVQRLHSSEEQLQTRWINAFVGRLFLALYKTPEMEKTLRNKITKKISRAKTPAFLSDIVIQNIDIGAGAPYITNPRLKDLTVDGECSVEADVQYSGDFRLEIAATARIDLSAARIKAREVNLVLAAVLKKLEGHVIFRFKPPPSNRIWVSFETMPKMELSIEPIVSSRQITYNVILRAIENRIREVVAETLVLPHWDDIPFTDTMGHKVRGGIWAKQSPGDTSTAAEVKERQHTEKVDRNDVTAAQQFRSREKTMSMPILKSPTSSHKSHLSHEFRQGEDVGTSSGFQSRPVHEKPKALRSQSFNSSSPPSIGTDTTPADAVRPESTGRGQDATSAMIAISNRSQPGSPTDSPVGSPSRRSSYIGHTRGSQSSASSKEISDIFNEGITPQQSRKSVHTSFPSSPASISNDSVSPLATSDDTSSRHGSLSSTVAGLDKKQSLAALGAATTAAKKWGFGVLNRNSDRRTTLDVANEHSHAAPSHPMGRGRPLPPPGMPLPPPEKKTKTKSTNTTSRKPLPQTLRTQKKDESPRKENTSLPGRRAMDHSHERSNGGVFVVAAPTTESEPASPSEEAGPAFEHDMDLDHSSSNIPIPDHVGALQEDEYGSAGSNTGSNGARQEDEDESAGSNTGSKRSTRSFSRPSTMFSEDSGEHSWDVAQEEENRSKSLWVEPEAGQS